jgi:hypothetical protein
MKSNKLLCVHSSLYRRGSTLRELLKREVKIPPVYRQVQFSLELGGGGVRGGNRVRKYVGKHPAKENDNKTRLEQRERDNYRKTSIEKQHG